jgi:hypothetical protein
MLPGIEDMGIEWLWLWNGFGMVMVVVVAWYYIEMILV